MAQSPKKLTVSQLVIIPAFYGTQRFITAFTSVWCLSLSWARSIQSMSPSNFLKTHFNIILPSIPSSSKWPLSLRSSRQKPCMHSSCLPYVLHTLPISIHSLQIFIIYKGKPVYQTLITLIAAAWRPHQPPKLRGAKSLVLFLIFCQTYSAFDIPNLTFREPCIVIYILIIKPTRYTNFWNLFLEWNSTWFGQFLYPS